MCSHNYLTEYNCLLAVGENPIAILKAASNIIRKELGVFDLTLQVEEYREDMQDCNKCQEPKDWSSKIVKRDVFCEKVYSYFIYCIFCFPGIHKVSFPHHVKCRSPNKSFSFIVEKWGWYVRYRKIQNSI